MQSVFRAFHSAETVLLRVNADIVTTLDSIKMAELILFYHNAAFDTIKQNVLLERLSHRFGIKKWILSNLASKPGSTRFRIGADSIYPLCGTSLRHYRKTCG